MAYTFKHGDRPLDGYTIQRAVGRGGFGEVYYAISDGGREVALKYLRDNPQVELRGVSNCINLKSPHLVSIFDVKQTSDGEYVIIMEYCSGPSLRDLLVAEPQGFAPEKAAFFAREIGKGLSYLHDRGIVHRDLKPGNIFFDDGYVKIGDYGLSKFISVSRHSAQTASVGTVHYMAPEIGSGDYSRGVDIYALGVILYEMLRGRVPFDGSTMAEILMKHLTSQPEVDNLPEPFGRVIRKALEKDPRDRYATVDEMMEELLAVEAIRESLAGFSVRSLEGAVARGGADASSPIPSPNPVPQPFAGPRGIPVSEPPPLPDRVAKRIDAAGRRIDRKLERMARRRGGQRREHAPALQAGSGPSTDRFKRIMLSLLMAVGLSVALGIVTGANVRPEAGASAGMLVCLMAIAVGAASKAVSWFGATYGPRWAQLVIRAGCSAPLLAIGAAPLMASRHSEEGVGLWLGLLAVAVFGNWNRTFERARDGEVSIGAAAWTALGALIATSIAIGMMGEEPPPYLFIAAAVAGAASLIVQASTWWASATGGARSGPGGDGTASGADAAGNRTQADEAGSATVPPYAQPLPFDDPNAARMYTTMQRAMHAARYGRQGQAEAAAEYDPRLRSGFTRAFWSIVSFLLMTGAIITFLLTVLLDDVHYDDRTGIIFGCIACATLFTFTVRKTTPLKKVGFWRETARPFLLAVSMFGIGGTITGIVRDWVGRPPEDHALYIAGLLCSSLLFLFLLVERGKGWRAWAPFLNEVGKYFGFAVSAGVEPDRPIDPGDSDEDDSARARAAPLIVQASTWWASATGGARPGSSGDGAAPENPRLRWDVTRAFWSIASFLLMVGAISTFVVTLVLDDLSYEDRTGTILGCIACAAMFTFTVRKTTPLKREGFWRETARPFFLALTMFGIGGTITAIVRHWHEVGTEEHAMMIVGLSFSSLWFLLLLFVFRGRRKATPPFLYGDSETAGQAAPRRELNQEERKGSDAHEAVDAGS